MKNLLVAVALFVSGVANASGFTNPRAQVVLLEAENGSCSGVVVAPQVVLSAKHCEVLINPQINGVPAFAGRKSPTTDLMLFQGAVDCPCAPLAEIGPELDEAVLVVGFPFWHNVGVQFATEGRYQGTTPPGVDSPYVGDYAISAHASPGNSGGGVYVRRGREWQLIGILVAGFGSPDGYINYAVPLSAIRAFLPAV